MTTLVISADVTYGARTHDDDLNDWQRTANGWTVELRCDGHTMTVDYWTGPAISGEPTAADVLSAVLLDASLGVEDFETFCADLGYDTDSRRAYASWEACRARVEEFDAFLPDWRTALDGYSDPSDFGDDDQGNAVVEVDD